MVVFKDHGGVWKSNICTAYIKGIQIKKHLMKNKRVKFQKPFEKKKKFRVEKAFQHEQRILAHVIEGPASQITLRRE